MHESLNTFEHTIGVVFRDKTLLQRALTHRSYLNEFPEFPLSDNERLEFLGDAVLGFVIAAHLYNRFPEQREGILTAYRSALVRGDTLAHFANQISLGDYLFMGHGEAETGGRERTATLSAGMEALIGAIYLDQGVETVKQFLMPLVEPYLAQVLRESPVYKDAKSRLQELAQSCLQITPHYETVDEQGPDHLKEFTVQVLLGVAVYGTGIGHSKRKAEQLAAEEALIKLNAECTERSWQAGGGPDGEI